MSHYRCRTYKMLAERFKNAADRVLKGTGVSREQLGASLTDGFRKEIETQTLVEACCKVGFSDEWFETKKVRKKKALSACRKCICRPCVVVSGRRSVLGTSFCDDVSLGCKTWMA